jgi:hypothetical protein
VFKTSFFVREVYERLFFCVKFIVSILFPIPARGRLIGYGMTRKREKTDPTAGLSLIMDVSPVAASKLT